MYNINITINTDAKFQLENKKEKEINIIDKLLCYYHDKKVNGYLVTYHYKNVPEEIRNELLSARLHRYGYVVSIDGIGKNTAIGGEREGRNVNKWSDMMWRYNVDF
jgi:hypothetical protein